MIEYKMKYEIDYLHLEAKMNNRIIKIRKDIILRFYILLKVIYKLTTESNSNNYDHLLYKYIDSDKDGFYNELHEINRIITFFYMPFDIEWYIAGYDHTIIDNELIYTGAEPDENILHMKTRYRTCIKANYSNELMNKIKFYRKNKIDVDGLDYWRYFMYCSELHHFFGNRIYYYDDYSYVKRYFGNINLGLIAETIDIINIIKDKYENLYDNKLIQMIEGYVNKIYINIV